MPKRFHKIESSSNVDNGRKWKNGLETVSSATRLTQQEDVQVSILWTSVSREILFPKNYFIQMHSQNTNNDKNTN
jgi:hypothetical protein